LEPGIKAAAQLNPRTAHRLNDSQLKSAGVIDTNEISALDLDAGRLAHAEAVP
jgi:hypothetical protein